MVPLAGIEPALLAESDFESDASTNSATGAPSPGDNCVSLEAGSGQRLVEANGTGWAVRFPVKSIFSGAVARKRA
jgi:hypothetical protein